jgi:uncharacterized DUF497 family protein
MYNKLMDYEWDPQEARANYHKHKIHFADAVSAFSDDYALTIEDDFEFEAERRFITLGRDAFGRVLFIVYTYRHEYLIRLISARKATAAERTHYET